MSARSPSIAAHYLRYSTGSFLVLVAGFISFPILTRLLDNTQYGILGYCDTWIALGIGVTKLGSQHSILRFYPHRDETRAMERFATNLVLLPAMVSVLLWAFAAAVTALIAMSGWDQFPPVFWFSLLLIPLGVLSSFTEMVFRAREMSGLTVAMRVVWRWVELAAILGAVVLVAHTAVAVYGGRVATAVVMLIAYSFLVRRYLKFSWTAIDPPMFRAALRYGIPLMASEIASVLLTSIDRVMLKSMTHGFAVVGVYTIGYSLAVTVSTFLHATLYEAFTPVANRVYETEGPTALCAMMDRILLPMAYCSIGIAAGLWCVGGDALLALSGSSKAASAPVFVLIGINYALFPLIDIAGVGLLLQKRSMLVLALTSAGAVLNIVLNLIMIPRYGVMGAVYATFISYAGIGIAQYLCCAPHLRRLPDGRAVLTAMALALILIAVASGTDLFGISSHWGRLGAMAALTLGLYVVPALLLDGRLRALIGFARA
jgi:O-antigen/teichoic acid export membrane protein